MSDAKQVNGEWTHTIHGQPVIDNVPLKHECNGASDYCMHCGVEMSGSAASKAPCAALERARRRQMKPETVTAFGCDKEARGDECCAKWCQSERCTYSREPRTDGVGGNDGR